MITALYSPNHLGGYELRCQDVVERLQARGHEVQVITSMYGVGQPQIEDSIARVLHLEPSTSLWQRIRWDTQDLRFIAKTIKSYRPDVIHLWHMAQLARTIFPFLAQKHVPVVYDEGGAGLLLAWKGHGRWLGFCEGRSRSRIRQVFKSILCRAVSLSTGGVLPIRWLWPENMFIYFNSAFTRERHRRAGVPVDGARVIHSGIELSRFPYRKRSVAHCTVRLLVPGRIHAEKGAEDALEALRQYLQHHKIEHIRGAPYHPQTQGKIERWHRSMKSVVKLDHYYTPEALEEAIASFVIYYNTRRYHESLDNVTPEAVYLGRREAILTQRQQIKQQTLRQRRQDYLQSVYMSG